MADWSRRQVLRALGMGAATPALAPLLEACGGSARNRRKNTIIETRPLDAIRIQLRDLVSELSRRYADVSALVTVRHLGGAAVDANERGANRERATALVLSASDAGGRFEYATDDVSAVGIEEAAASLRRSVSVADPVSETNELGAPVNFATKLEIDPASFTPHQWLEQVQSLYARARRVGGSRMVYRGAYLTVDDSDTLFIGNGRDLAQRIVRTRAGVLLVAWTGSSPTVDDAGKSGTIGLEALSVDSDELELAAKRALSLLTARRAPSGDMDVILAPSLSAILGHRCLAPALAADTWYARESIAADMKKVGSKAVTLIDDPSAAAGYGSYHFDDEGQAATKTVLIKGGMLVGPFTDRSSATALSVRRTANGRRPSPSGPPEPRPSNIELAGGTATLEDMIAGIKNGLLVESGVGARTNPRTWRYAMRAGRAQQIRDGKLTGALYGDLTLRGDIPSLLGQVGSVSATTARYPIATGRLAVQAGGPFMATRCEVIGG